MIDAIDGIQNTIAGLTFSKYQSSWQARRATERGIEIISEASRQIPKEQKERFPAVQWKQIAGIGNVLRHEYHRVEDRIIWEAVKKRLPALKAAITALRDEAEALADARKAKETRSQYLGVAKSKKLLAKMLRAKKR